MPGVDVFTRSNFKMKGKTITGKILDGKSLAQQLESELALRVQQIMQRSNGGIPILATILVGDDSASVTYVRM